MRVDSISMQGPYATGVKVMALAESDRVAAVAPVLVTDTGDDTASDDMAAEGTAGEGIASEGTASEGTAAGGPAPA